MGLAGVTTRVAAVLASLISAESASGVPSACDHSAYAYEDRVIVFGCDKQGAPEFQVIVLDDAKPLGVTGRVIASSSRVFDAAGHFKDFVMLVRWDQFEIYDVSEASQPKLAAHFVLKKQGSFAGYDSIEQSGENKFVITTSLGAVEVVAEGDPAKWTIREIPTDSGLLKKRLQPPPAWQFVNANVPKTVLKETAKFRYELTWIDKKSPGEIFRRQYVRKLDVSTGKQVSQLLLGERLETID